MGTFIKISTDTWQKLHDRKQLGESFNQVIQRVFKKLEEYELNTPRNPTEAPQS